MKKLILAVTAVIIAVICVSASIWEGAAAVSIGGELPEGGYYAATKSFPRNTVVDITNLETGKSVRAIVAAGLDSPGLLAILSKEAAELIGIQTRSIGRIRMTMPADPVAFSRFTEGVNPSGDPDYDPRAAIAAASPRQTPQTPQRTIIPSGPVVPSGTMPPVWEAPILPSPAAEPVPSPSSVQSGDPVIPADASAPPENVQWPWERPALSTPVERPVETPPEPARDTFLTGQPAETPAKPAADTFLAEGPAETPPDTESAYRPPVAAQQDGAITYERRPELIRNPEPENTAPARNTIVLEPAEPRPPAPYTSLPPNMGITPITSPSPVAANPVETVRKEDTVEIPDQYIIPGIAEAAPRTRAIPEEPDQVSKTETVRKNPANSSFQEPVSTQAAAVQFSAPLISNLEKGMYYLQLRAFTKKELVQSELSRLGDAYPLAVQAGGTSEKPLYRILIGPVNLGESNALLRRFKGNGYGDAFVRQAE
ncbi:MAG: SPOR domain-containing protein [Treponema sp.]|jgi:hypothetical protein|nr:SPOR domain-containing protein [Treponema sp.]